MKFFGQWSKEKITQKEVERSGSLLLSLTFTMMNEMEMKSSSEKV